MPKGVSNHGGNLGCMKFTAAQFIAAIPGTGGNLTVIAKNVGCSWVTAKKYVTKYPMIAAALKCEREGLLDLAMDKLVQAIENSEPWAIKFMLSTLGKKRGFSERLEVSGGDGGPIVIRYTGNADPGKL